MIVPNKRPLYEHPERRIALIGEAPGKDEVERGEPFVGASGRFLAALLRLAGTSREACFLGNVTQHRPPENNISAFEWDGEEIQSGLARLQEDLVAFRPNIVVLLGNTALKAAKDPASNHPLKPQRFRFKNKDWRGSLFLANGESIFSGFKCMATYHPAFALRAYDVTPLLTLDLKRAVEESSTPTLTLPKREIVIVTSFVQAIQVLREAREKRWTISPDIEGGLWTMSCISIAPSPSLAYVIPFTRKNATRVWTPDEEKAILVELCITMMDRGVPKIWQNGLYDRFVLQYSYHIPVLGNADDTMLAGWELNAELEKKLGVLLSVYTKEPYYKSDRKSDDDDTFYRYCGKDGAGAFELRNYFRGALRGTSLDHYELNLKLLNPLLYMELRGIRYDVAAAAARRQSLLKRMFEVQARLNALTGHCFPWKNLDEIKNHADAVMLTVKGDRPRKAYAEAYHLLEQLLRVGQPTLATIGEIEDLCEVSLNVDSQAFKDYLYEELKLPQQWKENKETGEMSLTADYEALLKLSRHCQKQSLPHELQVVQLAIELRALKTRAQMLEISADNDGRIRCGYNLVGSETGRITCYTSPTGSGYNLQTIPNYTNTKDAPGGVLGDRDLFLADPDHWLFQCDLAGADGWTYAAYAAMLGDSTMLDDYRFGLKPAKILALMLKGFQVDFSDREALKEASKKIDKDDWEYFACKRVQHGAAYVEGEITISRSILKDSEGKLFMEPSECGKLKRFYFTRYPGIPRWHDWTASRLKQRPVLTAASGQVRRFFGRPDELLTKAVAHEPQANTTYATNLAMYRLWSDPDNRLPEGRLRIEPLHQVHDALCGQFKKEDTAWAASKIHEWFENPLQIAGQSITIPYEGGYGPSWGELKVGKL